MRKNSTGIWFLDSHTREQWTYCDAFSKEECEGLIKAFHTLNIQDGVLEQGRSDDQIRNSRIAWLPMEEYSWVYERCASIASEANNQFFKFDLNYLEAMQLAVYSTEHPYYGKHCDYSVENVGGIRKLTFSLPLSNPSDYDGGDLCLYETDAPTVPEQRQGRMIFFPSYVLHEIKPVTRGTRYSLVGWVNGPRFK